MNKGHLQIKLILQKKNYHGVIFTKNSIYYFTNTNYFNFW